MSNPFVLIYKFFENKKGLFYLFLFLIAAGITYLSTRLSLQEDISAFIPKDERAKKYQESIKNLKVNDRLVINIFLKDTSAKNPDILSSYVESLADSIRSRFDSTWVKEIKYKIDDEAAAGVFDLLYSDLPYYLTEDDYSKIENSLSDSAVYNKIKSNYETIISPEGAVLKDYIIKDPLGLNKYALNKLARLQSDEKFELYNGYLSTKDNKHFILYLSTAYPSNDSEKNGKLVNSLSEIISKLDTLEYKSVKAEFFGTPAVSVSNVKQIKSDSFFTMAIALVLIFAGLLLYFRNLKTILLIFLPVAFGGGFAIALVYLIRTEISAIAIGAGSIVLGIAINYSLHYFTHLKHERSVIKTIADLTVPLTLGCTTTVGAFFCLHFMQSEALQDMGLFAGLSLLGAAFCCLIILPPLSKSYENKVEEEKSSVMNRFTSYPYHKNKFLLLLVVVLTIVFAFTYSKVGFETDMTKLSYVNPELELAENNLNEITDYKLKSIFLLSQGETLEEALKLNASAMPVVDKLVKENSVKKYSNIGEFLLTDSLRKVKINNWKNFWTPEKTKALQDRLYKYGKEFNFNSLAFDPVLMLVTKEFNPKNDSSVNELKKLFLQEYINETPNGISVITTLKVDQDNKIKIYDAFKGYDEVFVIDRGSMATMFAKILSEDFNLILALSAALVFGFIFLSYGRIELAILAFLPMLISWIWILGIMGITDFKFNIVNIIICTFIFGLGDDFSIFTIDGLEQEYKYGKNVLASYRNSIFLSAYTTIVGIGVLIFAKHPALQSIALITIIGIVCIVFVSMIIQPFLYDLFVLSRKRNGKLPITVYSLIVATIQFLYFIIGAFIIKLITPNSSKNKTNHSSLKFLNSIIAFQLFTERKLGEDILVGFVQRNIQLIPGASIELYNELYNSKKSSIETTSYFRGKLIKNYVFKGPVVEWYTRIKTGLEDNYKVFNELVPTKGKIVDVGCGYGYLSYMLSLTAPEREIIGVDYDDEKIEIAKNGVLRTSKLNFFCSDVLQYNYSKSDAFVISDVLHYLKEEDQAVLIRKCIDNLNDSGILIIRDGNSELQDRHKGTKLTEFFSTKIVGFNKVTIDKLCFTSKEKILETVAGYPVSVEILDNTQYTSNIIFIIRKK